MDTRAVLVAGVVLSMMMPALGQSCDAAPPDWSLHYDTEAGQDPPSATAGGMKGGGGIHWMNGLPIGNGSSCKR